MPSRLARTSRAADRLLNRFEVRLGLSVAIILSLLPWDDGRWHAVQWGFFAVFAVELTARALAWFHVPEEDDEERQAPGRRRLGQLVLLGVDLVALASFVPWSIGDAHARWLRLFRLTRLLLIAAYWAPLLRDLWGVLSRRERTRQIVLMGALVAAMSFAGAIVLSHLGASGLDFDDDGAVDASDERFLTQLWWAFRQIQDPGNMLAAPDQAIGVIVSLALTVFGLFLVSFLIGLGADVVRELVELNRNRPPGLRGHTVLVNVTPALPRLLHELMRYYRKLFAVPRYAILGHGDERPNFLNDAELARVVYRFGTPGESDLMARVDAARARRIVILADLEAADPDAETAGLMLMAREVNTHAWLVAEILHHDNVAAARVAGGSRTVVVPTERLLALVMAAMLRQPGLEDLLRILLTSHGHEIYTWFMDEPGLDCPGRRLVADRPVSFDAMLEAGLAALEGDRLVPLGFIVPCDPVTGPGPRGFELVMGGPPGAATRLPTREVRGFVALAQNFDAVRRFGERMLAHGLPAEVPVRSKQRGAPPVRRHAEAAARQVLLCGFRPATLHLCEQLIEADPEVEILLLVEDETAEARARAALSARGVRWRAGMPVGPDAEGHFEQRADGRFGYRPAGEVHARGLVELRLGDWTSDAVLLNLPGPPNAPTRHIGQMDVVTFFGGYDPASDGRTAVAVLKVADLMARAPDAFAPGFRMLAEVLDEALGRRLEQRFARAVGPTRAAAGRPLRIVSSKTLRACFALQSVTVPGFDAIFGEILAPHGPSFTAMRPEPGHALEARWSFAELAQALRVDGLILLGLELAGAEGSATILCPRAGAHGDTFRWRDVRTLWVLDGATGAGAVRVAPEAAPFRPGRKAQGSGRRPARV